MLNASLSRWLALGGGGMGALDEADVAQAGLPARPLFHEPKKAPAPNAANATRNGTATTQAMAACRMAGSERRMPAILTVHQPPATKEKNAPRIHQIIGHGRPDS